MKKPNGRRKTNMEHKCPKCNTEMEFVDDWPVNSSFTYGLSLALYQCPNCKTIKMEKY
jgi:uncharacterized protein with PIN domain